LLSAINPSFYGQNVQFTAVVQTNGTAAASAGGSVVFSVNGAPVATGTVAAGAAVYATAALTAGAHGVTASYGGDSTHESSMTSLSGDQVVNKTTPALIEPSASSIVVGQSLASSTLFGGSATNPYSGMVVPGGFAFEVPGAIPPEGTNLQNLVFLPYDLANFNGATSALNVVAYAMPVIDDGGMGSGGLVQFRYQAPTGSVLHVYSVTNLFSTNWTYVGIATQPVPATSWFYFSDTNAEAIKCFYRLQTP
jgi:hypothetical protein